MVALVSVETVLLVLLVVLVAGLLRSHAEILRRLGPDERPESLVPSPSGSVPSPPGSVRSPPGSVPSPPGSARLTRATAPELAGVTPTGDAVKLAFEGGAPTLLAFLTSGCSSCAHFWETLGERRLPPDMRIVIVTHGAERERPARLRSLTPTGVPVLMSSPAWEDYRVPGSPYFVLVEDGRIRGEGVATTWQALASLVSDAIEDQREVAGVSAGARRARRVDETFAAAGIGPDHPSLYPGRSP